MNKPKQIKNTSLVFRLAGILRVIAGMLIILLWLDRELFLRYPLIGAVVFSLSFLVWLWCSLYHNDKLINAGINGDYKEY